MNKEFDGFGANEDLLYWWSQVQIQLIFLMGHSRPLFSFFRLFNPVEGKKCSESILQMAGFEQRTSGVASDRSTN